MIPSFHRDPILAFRFHVEIEALQQILIGGFSEVSGLQVETVVETYHEGGQNDYEHKFRGHTRYPSNLILKHGLTDIDFFMWMWHEDVRQNNIQRRNGAIFLLGYLGIPTAIWTFQEAWPVKWTGSELRADANTVAYESIELVHRGIRRVSP